ncbi:hypothetical protein QFZ53_000683 [Microbacterium natoriense]|uniref:LamG domain-containing protein n=1 Tax=Microbacterium natoriense TaxID=284570 RepID=A0AAW8EVT5_9MICO|nr:LamG domain-containing protein [Microbacterium natoriense]MDQ0646487.1 hypothetical protein [Microbacterium natoriense]
MISRRSLLSVGIGIALGLTHAPQPKAVSVSGYDDLVLADGPVGYWPMAQPAAGYETDLTGRGRTGYYTGPTTTVAMPNQDRAAVFDGIDDFFQIADQADFSISTTRRFTFEAWLQPHTLQFTDDEATGYVHFIGKGMGSGSQEWAGRMYSQVNAENRPNRLSGYAWNLSGGYGAGAYFQDAVTVNQWIHYATTFNLDEGAYGTVRIYKNGVLRQTRDLVYEPGTANEVVVTPGDGTAPVRVGSRDGASFFKGAIAKVALYNKAVSGSALAAHYSQMFA